MKRHTITEAKEAAGRFIAAVDKLHEREEADDYFRRHMNSGSGFKETAAVRRASLDLTRALAEMRKP
jgi:hypothetical protein